MKDISGLTPLAREKGVSIYCLILAWLRAKSPCILPIPGASRVRTIQDSTKAVRITLSPEEVHLIDKFADAFQPSQHPKKRFPGSRTLKSALRKIERFLS